VPGPQIYQSIGVEPVINCRGTFTIIGASVELPEVRQAMEYAAQYFVQLDELAMGVGKRLSEITGAEWGMVSAGCAAGMKHVTAACVSGGNPEKLIRIPNLEGFEKTEVIIPKASRNVYDHAIRNIGVNIITVETEEELKNAISSRTAMIYYFAGTGGELTLDHLVSAAKSKKVPILVDAAAENLTIPNVHLEKGATVVAYSGGKALRGPQCAGLLLGNKNLLMSAWQASAPHHGPGRDNKLGREEHVGMLAAVEAWTKRDHEKEMKTWNSYLDNIAKRVSGIESVKTITRQPTGASNRTPTLTITWDPDKLHITAAEVADELSTTKPRIALSTGGGGGGAVKSQATDPNPNAPKTSSISIASWMMQPGNDKIVGDRIHEVLSRKRSPKSEEIKPPSQNLGGRWDMVVDFFTSKSEHQLLIEKQDGNWIQGSHKGDFAVREMIGTIEGDQVKLRSNYNAPGANIVFTFTGTVNGDTMTGKIHMGEYLTSSFTAKRHAYNSPRMPIQVPNGPPLSS
jgi:seryl-tRNA(Sec) selenium transferase